MRLDMSQQMKMDQRMVLAPRMIQSMEILQLPLLALQERIEQELLTNPVLELENPDQTENSQDDSSIESENPYEISDSEKTLSIKEDKDKADDFERLANVGNDYDEYIDRANHIRKQGDNDKDRKMEAMQNTAAPTQSLIEYLKDQWAFIECNPIVKKIGLSIIDLINDAGYLTVELHKIQKYIQEPVTPRQLNEALDLVHTLEPTGVGARNLGECMKLQLESSSDDRTLEIELVTRYLKDIEMNRFPAIVRKSGRSLEEIKMAIKNISHLDPRPGLQISSQVPNYIMPEIIVEFDELNDTYTARLTDGSSPVLRINKIYEPLLKKKQLGAEAKEFIQNSVRTAKWLIESVEQRKATLMRVVNHVIKNQRDFFDYGAQHLKPLPMVEVAEVLGIHVGTVSRAVSGKYMQTPIGIFALRYFFSGGTENAAGESVSWDAIKAKLQEIVDNEDKKKPYNDDQLVEQLVKSGLTVARRTVAKYRNLMNIPPARRRKEFE